MSLWGHMARSAYGHGRIDRPRRCVFVATTNEDTYLRDATGNRRFWPVKVGIIDLAGITRDRDQLWAEAAALEAQGEPLTIPEVLWSEAAIEQKARREPDLWEDAITGHLDPLMKKQIGAGLEGRWAIAVDDGGLRQFRVSTAYVLEFLGISHDRQSDAASKRLANVMKEMGWTRHENVIRIVGKTCRGFTKTLEVAPNVIPAPAMQLVAPTTVLALKRRKL